MQNLQRVAKCLPVRGRQRTADGYGVARHDRRSGYRRQIQYGPMPLLEIPVGAQVALQQAVEFREVRKLRVQRIESRSRHGRGADHAHAMNDAQFRQRNQVRAGANPADRRRSRCVSSLSTIMTFSRAERFPLTSRSL